ncbi:MAG: 2-C-methyl-D-erythritol 4-phosphate cytidylyltransferase [Candidatus Omnitrophota bacterium]
MKDLSAIVLAAGKGYRFKSRTPKALARINSKPVIFYSLHTLSNHPSVKDIIVVTHDSIARKIVDVVRRFGIKKVRRIVRGGGRRQDSVSHALCVLDNNTEWVLIHDAARPFIECACVTAVIKQARRTGAAIVGVPVKATIKTVQSSPASYQRAGREKFRVQSKSKSRKSRSLIVKKTLDRDQLWEIQTPQVFRRDLIFKAYKRFGRFDVTDDAMLVEKLGVPVQVVAGSYRNIKITTSEDLAIAETILKSRLPK